MPLIGFMWKSITGNTLPFVTAGAAKAVLFVLLDKYNIER
jgi:hypothetical protein